MFCPKRRNNYLHLASPIIRNAKACGSAAALYPETAGYRQAADSHTNKATTSPERGLLRRTVSHFPRPLATAATFSDVHLAGKIYLTGKVPEMVLRGGPGHPESQDFRRFAVDDLPGQS